MPTFQPACRPVARSGLPHTSSSLALGLLITTFPSLLTWPRLPQRTVREQAFLQSAAGFPGLVIDRVTHHAYIDRTTAEQGLDELSLAYLTGATQQGALTMEHAAGLNELLRMPTDWFQGDAIVSQLIGPISLALQLTDEQQRALVYDPVLREALAHHLALRVGWLSHQLATLTDTSIVCLEEPLLDALTSPFVPIDWPRAMELLDIVFASAPGCAGVLAGSVGIGARQQHEPYWKPLLDTAGTILHFDVYHQQEALLASAGLLPGFLKRAGILIWGLVPADEERLHHETTDTLVARFLALLRQLTGRGIDRDTLLLASCISTCDHLSHLSTSAAEKALTLCANTAQRLRKMYGLETV